MNDAYLALRKMAVSGAVLAVISLPIAMAIGYALKGSPGLIGAAIGLGLAVTFIGITSAVALATKRLSVNALGVVVLSSWLLKIVLLMTVLSWLRGQDFYDRPILFVSMLIGLVGYLTIEAVISLKSRSLYVDPS